MLPDGWGDAAGWPNVWLGTTVENQREADRRIPHLVDVPAAVHFLSAEPLLEPMQPDLRGIDWVICGGESGHGARAMQGNWARSLRDRCAEDGVPFLFKQWGEHRDGLRLGKKQAGRALDGVTHDAFPATPSIRRTA